MAALADQVGGRCAGKCLYMVAKALLVAPCTYALGRGSARDNLVLLCLAGLDRACCAYPVRCGGTRRPLDLIDAAWRRTCAADRRVSRTAGCRKPLVRSALGSAVGALAVCAECTRCRFILGVVTHVTALADPVGGRCARGDLQLVAQTLLAATTALSIRSCRALGCFKLLGRTLTACCASPLISTPPLAFSGKVSPGFAITEN